MSTSLRVTSIAISLVCGYSIVGYTQPTDQPSVNIHRYSVTQQNITVDVSLMTTEARIMSPLFVVYMLIEDRMGRRALHVVEQPHDPSSRWAEYPPLRIDTSMSLEEQMEFLRQRSLNRPMVNAREYRPYRLSAPHRHTGTVLASRLEVWHNGTPMAAREEPPAIRRQFLQISDYWYRGK